MFLEAALSGSPPIKKLGNGDRLTRTLAGFGLLGIGLANALIWPLIVLGSLVLFNAVYDRCPVWQAHTSKIAGMTCHKKTSDEIFSLFIARTYLAHPVIAFIDDF